METNERGAVTGKQTFAIEDGTEVPKPLWRRGWFRVAAVLLVFAIAAAIVVQTQGDSFLASWYSSRAEAKAAQGDYDGAVADMTQAIAKTPKDLELYIQRGEYQLLCEEADLKAALADYDHVLKNDPEYATGYARRSLVYQRMAFNADDPDKAKELHAKAIEDLKQALPLMPKNDPEYLNQLAYARALAGVDLDEALVEINLALRGIDAPSLLARLQNSPDGQAALDALTARSLIDTRGYIQHLRGENDAALADMDQALELHDAALEFLGSGVIADSDQRSAFLAQQQEVRGVLLHHRGLIHKAQGNEEQAQADLDKADDLGFDPRGGVF